MVVREIDNFLKKGFSIKKIAEYTKVSRTTLYAYINKKGCYSPKKLQKSFDHILSKMLIYYYFEIPGVLTKCSTIKQVKNVNLINYVQALTANMN